METALVRGFAKTCAFLAMLAVPLAPAIARDDDGRLDKITAPCSGRPLFGRSGATIGVRLAAPGDLWLVGPAARYPLAIVENNGPMYTARLPAEVPAGAYGLEWQRSGVTDRNPASVFVYSSFPPGYTVVLGASLWDPARLRDELGRASDAAFTILTGPLTGRGGQQQWRALARALDETPRPVVVCPAQEDIDSGFRHFFGAQNHGFRFGRDGILAIGAQSDRAAGEHGAVYSMRREFRAARWSLGVSASAFQPDMRRTYTLFVDDPLDYWITLVPAENDITHPFFWSATRPVPLAVAPGGTVHRLSIQAAGLRVQTP